jgi:hypothetical protein
MSKPHPYLDQHENPSAALFRLLQLMRDHMQETGAFDLDELQLAQAIAYQATQAHQRINQGMAAIMPYLPPMPEPHSPHHADIANLLTYLHQESDGAKLLADNYQWMVNDFYDNHPDLQAFIAYPPGERKRYSQLVAEQARALVAKYDKHYYFPLGRLMQLLPGDITNVPRLTPEQAEMCTVVSRLACSAAGTIGSGLLALEEMRHIVGKLAPKMDLPDCSAFVAYLQAEAEFMQEAKADYQAAAWHIERKA